MSKRQTTQDLGEMKFTKKKLDNVLDREVEPILRMLRSKMEETSVPWTYELELKLCTGENNQSNVSMEEYERVLSTIRKYPCWVETDTHTLVMSHGVNARVTYDMKTKECLGTMVKTRFDNTVWKSSLFDAKLKLSLSGELPIVTHPDVDTNTVCFCPDWRHAQRIQGKKPTHFREKTRASFAHVSGAIPWQLDVTYVPSSGWEIEVEFTSLIWELDEDEQRECVGDMLIWIRSLLNGSDLSEDFTLDFIVQRAKERQEKN